MENRFGMFVHWGIYALTEDHEQAFARRDLDRAGYEALAKRFDPVRYDPEDWVKLALDAGMTYLCFTAKHHDGFCMWDTKQTDYNVMHTPYGKDVLAMLSRACAKYGMKLSLYYSNPDWHEPCAYNPLSSHQWKSPDPAAGDPEQYRRFVREQLRELLTGYGPVYTLFWDISPRYTDPSMNEYVRSLQPGILINDRGYDAGDFSTPEREVPEGNRFERMTEACQSVGEQSWGYRKNEDYYTPRYLMSSIDKVMAMGGSYLLNAGPMPDGRIPDVSRRIIGRVGDWFRRMEGSLCGHEREPFDFDIRGNRYVAVRKDGRTYLHFYEGLISTAVSLHRCPAVPARVRLMNGGEDLPFEVTCLPNEADWTTGISVDPVVRIHDIPCERFTDEPIVLEIRWE